MSRRAQFGSDGVKGLTRRVFLKAGVAAAFFGAVGGARAIDLSKDFARLQEREYFIRIGLVEDERELRVVPRGEFTLHDRTGEILHTGQADEAIRFRRVKTSPATTVYYYLLANFEPERREEAERYARRASERLDRPVIVMPDPHREYAPSPITGKPPKSLMLVAAAGPYNSYDAAKRDESRVYAQYDPELFKTVDREAQGEIEAINAAGKVLARAENYLGVRPKQRATLLRGGRAPSDAGDWASADSWKKDLSYRGLMEVWINPNGNLTLVNRVFLEHYLYGVVPPEIGVGAPQEMKKVQAVVARSEAIHKLDMQRHAGWHFDLCNEQHCQVYKGALVEEAGANEAVNSTWGQVATHGDEIIDAVYSMCCGGVTASSSHAWQGDGSPYLQWRVDAPTSLGRADFSDYKTVEKWLSEEPDVFCNPNQKGYPNYAKKYFRWTTTLTAEELGDALRKRNYHFSGPATNFEVTRRTASGHVWEIRVATETGRRITIDGETPVRMAMGGLRSTFFTIDRAYDDAGALKTLTVRGAGYGHGVGLCQMGAFMMTTRGHNYVDVLKHYFKGVEIYRIYR